MTLKEVCTECDWEAKWEGGPAADDPGMLHALVTGHTITTEIT